MSARLLSYEQIESDRLTLDIERWLSGDPSVNLAPDMYIGDLDDDRWVRGHSSPSYYVRKDERETFEMVKDELKVKADNIFDLGVGGKQAVLNVGLCLAQKISAKNYYGFDLATTLAEDAAELALDHGFNGTSVVCDIFEKLPVSKPNTLIALLGLTLGNIETLETPRDVQNRLKEIFVHYREAVTPLDNINHASPNHLLISYDANRSLQEVRDCYFNPEFEGLIRSCVDKAIDTSGFDFDVVLRETPEILFLSTGLRAKHDQIIGFNGREFAIEKDEFLPVLNSSRFSTAFMTEAARQAGWSPITLWSATGRIQYQHFTVGKP